MNQRILMTFFMGLTAATLAATHAHAAPRNCGPHDAVTTHLADTFRESRVMMGLTANNMVLEVFAATTGSWTITVTRPGGPACIVASGESFQALADALPNTDPET